MNNSNKNCAQRAFSITPGAGLLATTPGKGLLVAAAGNVTVEIDGVSIAFTSVSAGQHLPIVPQKVTAATATVVGLY